MLKRSALTLFTVANLCDQLGTDNTKYQFNLTVRFILLLARIRFWYQWCWQEGSFCALSANQSPSNEQKGLHLK